MWGEGEWPCSVLAEGLSGLAEQGHQQEEQCHCVAGTPEVHPARVGCKASSSCSPDPTFPLEPLLAMLGRGDTWHLLCHPFPAPSSHPLYVAGGFPPSHTHTMMPFGWKSRDTAVALPSLGDQLGHLACVSPHCCLLPLRVREAPWGGLGRQAGAGHCSETMLLAWIIDREMCQLAASPPPHCPHTPRSGTVTGLGHPGEAGLAQNCLGIPWHGNSWYVWTVPA